MTLRLTSLFLSTIAAATVAAGSARAAPVSADAIMAAAQPAAMIHTIHGCHQSWAPSREGWHRHGPRCEKREGVTDQRKRGKNKGLAA
jgi:hypothetical protein